MITANRQRDMPSEIMGKSASFALGVCLAQPDTKVIIFDGDGGLEMNLGTLATISGQQPSNLYHFVFENGMYATTGGQPIPGKDKISFTGLARAAGYIAAHDFEDLEDFADQVRLSVSLAAEDLQQLQRELADATSGRVCLELDEWTEDTRDEGDR